MKRAVGGRCGATGKTCQLDALFQRRRNERVGRRIDGSIDLRKRQTLLASLVGRQLLGLRRRLSLQLRLWLSPVRIAQVADRVDQTHLLRSKQQKGQEQPQEEWLTFHDSGF